MNVLKRAFQLEHNTLSARVITMALLLAAAVLPLQAFATPSINLPTAAVLAMIALVVVFLTAVGGAILGLHYVAKSFGWAKKV